MTIVENEEQISIILQQSYCDIRGIEVNFNTNLKRFGKLFCSNLYLYQYIKTK